MARGQPEPTAGLGAGQLLEHAQRDDLALDVGERRHAAGELRDQLAVARDAIRRRAAGERGVVGDHVRARAMVAPPGVARGVADDRREHARELVAGRGEQVRPLEHERDRVLDGVDRVVGAEALAARDRRELASVRAHQVADPRTVTVIAGATHGAHGW